MTSTQSLVVPDSLSFIEGLIIAVVPTVDTTSPQGPDSLEVVSSVPDVSVTLDWSGWPCVEENFGYYEILFDTTYFYDEATYSWDWSEDASLTVQGTASTTVFLPAVATGFVFRIRAWDAFGNVGPVSHYCFVGWPTQVPYPVLGSSRNQLQQNSPNPFNPRTTIRFDLAQDSLINLDIFDIRGRCVRRLHRGRLPAGAHEIVWDGYHDNGEQAASGIYFYRLEGCGAVETRKMTLVK
jgi:hypothetical protein